MEVDLSTIQSTAPWVLIGIAVVAVVLAIVIKKIVGKIIVLVLAAVLIFVGWQQRQQRHRLRQRREGQRLWSVGDVRAGWMSPLPDDWCDARLPRGQVALPVGGAAARPAFGCRQRGSPSAAARFSRRLTTQWAIAGNALAQTTMTTAAITMRSRFSAMKSIWPRK